jgi:hypothetical protein
MKHWTDQAAGHVPLTGATGYVAGRLLRKLEESDGRCATCWRVLVRPLIASSSRDAAKDRTGCDREPERLIPPARRHRRHGSPRPRTIFRTAASERGQDDETADVEIGPAQLAVEGVAVSRVTLL